MLNKSIVIVKQINLNLVQNSKRDSSCLKKPRHHEHKDAPVSQTHSHLNHMQPKEKLWQNKLMTSKEIYWKPKRHIQVQFLLGTQIGVEEKKGESSCSSSKILYSAS